MPRPLALSRVRPALRRALRAADRLELALDFDGTLAPIGPRPDVVTMPPRTRRTLERVARLPGVRVAILSGRTLRDLRRTARVRRVLYAGGSGMEIGGAPSQNGARRQPSRIPAALVAELRAWCERFPRAWVEDKRVTIAVHDRALAASRRASFVRGLARIARGYASDVYVEHGRRVHEVRPVGAPDKSHALAHWFGQRNGRVASGVAAVHGENGRALFYFGDDTNDEPALEWVRRHGGFAVAVGRRRSHAPYHVRGPVDVIREVEWIAREWASQNETRPRRTRAASVRASASPSSARVRPRRPA